MEQLSLTATKFGMTSEEFKETIRELGKREEAVGRAEKASKDEEDAVQEGREANARLSEQLETQLKNQEARFQGLISRESEVDAREGQAGREISRRLMELEERETSFGEEQAVHKDSIGTVNEQLSVSADKLKAMGYLKIAAYLTSLAIFIEAHMLNWRKYAKDDYNLTDAEEKDKWEKYHPNWERRRLKFLPKPKRGGR